MNSQKNNIYTFYNDASKVSQYIKKDILTFLENTARQTDFDLQNQLFKKLVRNYVDLTRQLEENLIEIERLSVTDKLTQIFNRLKFDEELDSEISRTRRYKHEFALILYDIDHFKKVNDTYGHAAGDAILVETAKIVKENIRATDVFARWGGEEFVVLMPEAKIENGRNLAEKLRRKIEKYNFPYAGRITCSFGCAEFTGKGDANRLLQKVDSALYKAKKSGRNCVKIQP